MHITPRAQGAALGTMAALLTYGNRKFEHLDGQLRAVLPKLHDAYERMLPLVDRDTIAFTNYIVRSLTHTLAAVAQLSHLQYTTCAFQVDTKSINNTQTVQVRKEYLES